MLVIIIVVIFALLLIGVYFLGKSGAFNSKGSPEQPKTYDEKKYSMGQNAYLPVSTWSQFKPNDKSDKYSGSCINYTVKSNTLSLGFPSIDDLNNNSSNYVKSTQECVDPDQILAQAGTHTCQNPNNGGGGTGCIASTNFIGSDNKSYSAGDYVPVGITEGLINSSNPNNPYYITCGSKACPGEIGLIVPNFTNIINPKDTLSSKTNPNYPNCIQNNGVTEPNTGAFYTSILSCDLSDSSQVFRMVRYSFDDTYTPTVDPAGIYAAIIHRATGFYLAPDMEYKQSINPVTGDFVANSYTYYFDSLIVNTDPVDSTNTYVNLILINPIYDNVRNGIYWLLQNQTPDATKPPAAVDPVNSINCDAGLIYPISVGSSVGSQVPSNCLDTGVPPWYNPFNPTANGVAGTPNTDLYFPFSPQQFVYVPNIYLVPKDNTDLVEYWTYLTNQYSIQLDYVNEIDKNNWRAIDDAYKGVWNAVTEYFKGDIVYYNLIGFEGFYLSINTSTAILPSTLGPNWTQVVFDGVTPSIAKSLPLIGNYQGIWNASKSYYGPSNNITVNPNYTGDFVNSISGSNTFTFVNIDSTAPVSPETRPVTPVPPGSAVLPNPVPLQTPPPPLLPPASNSYWQQIYTYSSTASFSYVQGQLFATSEGRCYVYIGSSSSSTLPVLYTSTNIPLLKKFLTKIPADVYYYSNQNNNPVSLSYPNPFYGSNGPNTNVIVPAPFDSANTGLHVPYMDFIPSDIYNKYYSGGSNEVIAAIVPKLTTSITLTNPLPVSSTHPPNPPPVPPTPFNDITKLLDSQFIGATNLTLQLQSPISNIRDPISYQYTSFNPFNAVVK